MTERIGYDYTPETAGGNYLRLRKKGDSVKLRLVSTPVHYQSEYQGKPREKFAWLVIDRSDSSVRIFDAGVSIYLAIKGYTENEDWGDPTGYDFTITRTEDSTANYYRVVPSPNKAPLTKVEMELVSSSHIDLVNAVGKGNKGTNTFGEPKVVEEVPLPEDIPF